MKGLYLVFRDMGIGWTLKTGLNSSFKIVGKVLGIVLRFSKEMTCTLARCLGDMRFSLDRFYNIEAMEAQYTPATVVIIADELFLGEVQVVHIVYIAQVFRAKNKT